MKRSRLWAAVSGLLAGCCNGLFGAGGGMVLTPCLQCLTDIEQQRLFPTTLVSVLPLCAVSLTVYGLRGQLPWQAAWPYLVGSTVGGILSWLLGRNIPVKWLHRLLGLILLTGAARALLFS